MKAVPDRECSSVPGCADASACLKVTHPGDRARPLRDCSSPVPARKRSYCRDFCAAASHVS